MSFIFDPEPMTPPTRWEKVFWAVWLAVVIALAAYGALS